MKNLNFTFLLRLLLATIFSCDKETKMERSGTNPFFPFLLMEIAEKNKTINKNPTN